jgi:hypothetical protein
MFTDVKDRKGIRSLWPVHKTKFTLTVIVIVVNCGIATLFLARGESGISRFFVANCNGKAPI